MTADHQQQQHHQHHASNENDTVLIVGAGIAGMMLALLLQKAGIPYDIYERAAEVKALGSALFFSATTAPIFKQVGIYEELYALGKNTSSIQIASEQGIEYKMNFKDQQELFGSEGYIISRPMLYDVLRRQIPKERFHLGRKVVSISQQDDVDKNCNPGKGGVTIEFQDGSTVRGGILVGADGAYSVVRQSLYSQLKEKNVLPASDDVPLPFNVVCLVGQTKPLDPEMYPYLKLEDCQFIRTLGDNKPYTEHGSFKNSEWGPEAVETMCDKVRSFPIISGSERPWTLGDLIDNTPKELISKVMLEEKVFETWHYGRAVLIGDACHKLNPAGGSGANCAIHDAVALANRIYALPENRTRADIDQAFKAYRDERMPWVEAAFNTSTMMKSMVQKGLKATLIRFLSRNMPDWVTRRITIKMQYYQPQAAFLPLIENQGTVKPAFQEGLHDTLPIVEARRKSKHAAKHTSDADAGTTTSIASTT
ncbi:hypothetical protein BG015_001393 [Linnemannia schmuckeri]|uniref:FAD-binding domain-containing protein n=1 Tax=Linnemannia schmuckeri TaxID=64567 RepID=A0A9P5S4D7_9FUNG|nr:hypothetical protein BG015_001393 [Linnemannia schmuckeri]